jgi:hypothetical protein
MFTFRIDRKTEQITMSVKGVKGSVKIPESQLAGIVESVLEAKKRLKIIRRDKAREG